jgi:hypothetical protein
MATVNITMTAKANVAVAMAFLEACEKNGVSDYRHVLKACGSTVGLDVLFKDDLPNLSSGIAAIQVKETEPAKALTRRSLTPEEAKQAKAVARERKAKRLGVSVTEINLTPQEADAVRAEFRALIERGEKLPSAKEVRSGSLKSEKQQPEKKTFLVTGLPQRMDSPLRKQATPDAGSSSPKGEDTAWTRVKGAKTDCMRNFPIKIENPCGLHLVAYTNCFHRLQYHWEKYRIEFPQDASSKKNPYVNLADPEGKELPKTRNYLEGLTLGLRQHVNQPFVTWVLQDEDGRSFFDKGRPSVEHCPEILRPVIPKDILTELAVHSIDFNRYSLLD